MNKHKCFFILIAMSAIALIGSAAGCTPTAPTAPAAQPVINSFTASPTSISQGQSTTLSWDVSGATTITIEPAIGTSGPSGSLKLTPDASITYTLTATNQTGSATSSVSRGGGGLRFQTGLFRREKFVTVKRDIETVNTGRIVPVPNVKAYL